MKLNEVLKTGLPVYRGNIASWEHWIDIRDSGKYNSHKIIGDFDCYNNSELNSLIGAPEEIDGAFSCFRNNLTSLKGGPRIVSGNYMCGHNKLKSLIGAPEEIDGVFSCFGNNLTSLEGGPRIVSGDYTCAQNKLNSLTGIHKHIKECKYLHFKKNPITSNILGLLFIKNLRRITGDSPAFKIIEKHLLGDRDVLECQEELISAGYKEFAKL